jgi:hypothetical protein
VNTKVTNSSIFDHPYLEALFGGMIFPDGKYMIGLEGFVYAPKFDKRQYLRQVEAIIYSFEWAKPEEDSKKE